MSRSMDSKVEETLTGNYFTGKLEDRVKLKWTITNKCNDAEVVKGDRGYSDIYFCLSEDKVPHYRYWLMGDGGVSNFCLPVVILD